MAEYERRFGKDAGRRGEAKVGVPKKLTVRPASPLLATLSEITYDGQLVAPPRSILKQGLGHRRNSRVKFKKESTRHLRFRSFADDDSESTNTFSVSTHGDGDKGGILEGLIDLISGAVESQLTTKERNDSLSHFSGDVRVGAAHKRSLLGSTEPTRGRETTGRAMGDPLGIQGVCIVEPPKVHRKKLESSGSESPHRATKERYRSINQSGARRTVASLAGRFDDMSMLQELEETQTDMMHPALKESFSALTKSLEMRHPVIAEGSRRMPDKKTEEMKGDSTSGNISSPGAQGEPSPKKRQEREPNRKDSPKSIMLMDRVAMENEGAESSFLGTPSRDTGITQRQAMAEEENSILLKFSGTPSPVRVSPKSHTVGSSDADMVHSKGSPSPPLPPKSPFSRKPLLARTTDESPSVPQAPSPRSWGRSQHRKPENSIVAHGSPRPEETKPGNQSMAHRTPSLMAKVKGNQRRSPSPRGLGSVKIPAFFSAIRRLGKKHHREKKTGVHTIIVTSSRSSLHPSSMASDNQAIEALEPSITTQKWIEQVEASPVAKRTLPSVSSENGFALGCLPLPQCGVQSLSIDQYAEEIRHHIEGIVNSFSAPKEAEQSLAQPPSSEKDNENRVSLFDMAMAKAVKELSSLTEAANNSDPSLKDMEAPPALSDREEERKKIPVGRINGKYRTKFAGQPEQTDDILIMADNSALSSDEQEQAKVGHEFSLSGVAAAAAMWQEHGLTCFNSKAGEALWKVDAEQTLSSVPVGDSLHNSWVDFGANSCFQETVTIDT